jgi:hypothetical protein
MLLSFLHEKFWVRKPGREAVSLDPVQKVIAEMKSLTDFFVEKIFQEEAQVKSSLSSLAQNRSIRHIAFS